MSQASIIILSEAVDAGQALAAFRRVTDGERLFIFPPKLQKAIRDEPALNIYQPDEALKLQLIDNAINALRPDTIIADVPSLELITPNLSRYPQLKTAIILVDTKQKKKRLTAQAAFFKKVSLLAV